jgi:hypothetical protein
MEKAATERERMNTIPQHFQSIHRTFSSGWLGALLTRRAEVLGPSFLIAFEFRGSLQA